MEERNPECTVEVGVGLHYSVQTAARQLLVTRCTMHSSALPGDAKIF